MTPGVNDVGLGNEYLNGTAKLTLEELQAFFQHFMDLLNSGQDLSGLANNPFIKPIGKSVSGKNAIGKNASVVGDTQNVVGDIQKPYPNEISARQSDPKQYKFIRRQNDKFGPGVHAIFGVKDDGKTEVQSIRFDASKFTVESARKWLEKHNYSVGSLEAATIKKDAGIVTDGMSTNPAGIPGPTCYNCKRKISGSDMVKIGERLLCKNCATTSIGKENVDRLYKAMGMAHCDNCGDPYPEFVLQENDEGEMVCPDCLDSMQKADTMIEKAGMTDVPWSNPIAELSANDYCSVCLIDVNEPGKEKIKSNCHLPVRSTPNGPVNKGAIRNASARLNQVENVPASAIASAKAKLARLSASAGIESKLNKGAESEFEVRADIIKADNEKHIMYAVVYNVGVDPESRTINMDKVDTQGDVMSAEEIEKMAHRWLMKSRRYDLQHKADLPTASVIPVESYIVPGDTVINNKIVNKGSWVVASYIPDETLWSKVKSGEINAYSVKGKGIRKKLATINY